MIAGSVYMSIRKGTPLRSSAAQILELNLLPSGEMVYPSRTVQV